MRLIAENNLSAENHYFQATNTTNEVLKFKTLFPVLQNFYERLALGWGLFGLLFSFITLGFFYRIVVEEKSSHLHFSSLKKTEVSNQYIFQFNLGSTDWSCSSKLNKVQQNFKTSHSTTKNLKPFSTPWEEKNPNLMSAWKCFGWHSQQAKIQGEKNRTYQLSKMYFSLVTAKIITELKTDNIAKASG